VHYGLEDTLERFVSGLGRPVEAPDGLTPWLRGVVIVSPQPSDELALHLLASGIVTVEDTSQSEAEPIVKAVVQQVQHFQDAIAPGPPTALVQTAGHDPSAPGAPARSGTESPFSKTPSYFDAELYHHWLSKLSEEWNPQDRWDSES
jgi:hypothetical protein